MITQAWKPVGLPLPEKTIHLVAVPRRGASRVLAAGRDQLAALLAATSPVA
jgi:hypothetical protein